MVSIIAVALALDELDLGQGEAIVAMFANVTGWRSILVYNYYDYGRLW